ncbi:MAG TPA: TAXI family TRAP transporter solute-binding subunit [Alphaproteobacteria bacterium]|jgi:TRAP transporter TAXI family solute receptor|nr:TAXI family TRAP transporter solute-binding subunit [Alphaproteobacteria bacterium]
MRHIVAALVAMTLACSSAPAQDRTGWPQYLTLGTASVGGTFSVYGNGIATLVRDYVGVPMQAQNTQGPTQNLVLVQNRQIDVGMTTLGPAWDAWNGDLEINKGVTHRDIRGLFPMYEAPFQIVALKKSGIASLRDLDGKTVGLGPPTATGASYFPKWFAEFGIRVSARSGQYIDLAGELINRRLDAVTFAGGLPNPSISDLEATQQIRIFAFTDEQRETLLKSNPFLSPFTVPAGSYRSLNQDQPTVAMWNIAIANKAMPDSLAYAIVRAVLTHQRQLAEMHASARETLPENINNDRFLWLHPGALRYYREIGIDVPAALVPPERNGH